MNDRPCQRQNNPREFICGVVEGFYGRPWSFDQRKDLFRQLKRLKLNSFMYAPKDDVKHRAKWRQLYSESEAAALEELIRAAKSNGINFYYSLAPGLDMVYSDEEELATLRRKFDQLAALGCESFAILFDDIEPAMNDKDAIVFKNYASAQVSVANSIYEHLGRPKFLFCPTEYCESRAVPNVPNSSYLNTVGAGLAPEIDFMWSGSRVVSRLITAESIEQLSRVIRRAPLIWENLHANDYDKKRVFLGPYSGRSTKIIPKLRGVLTNPNCEYEANYIAIHTLAQWSKCTEDANQHNRCNHAPRPTWPELGESTYEPSRALRRAIDDWLPTVLESRSAPDESPRERAAGAPEEEPVEMAVAQEEEAAKRSEMDTSGAEAAIDTNSCESCEMRDVSGEPPAPESGQARAQIDAETLALLADLFFLPFEHGARGCLLLNDIKWLTDNSDVLLRRNELAADSAKAEDLTTTPTRRETGDESAPMEASAEPAKVRGEELGKTVEFWEQRAGNLNNLCLSIERLVAAILHCPNKLLAGELRPYLAELRGLCLVVADYLRFLARRRSPADRFGPPPAECPPPRHAPQKEAEEQEPWVHRGGLLGDVQRLILERR